MRRLFLVTAFLMSSIAVMAQVKFFNGSIKEAMKKAKAENKNIMVLASTTW